MRDETGGSPLAKGTAGQTVVLCSYDGQLLRAAARYFAEAGEWERCILQRRGQPLLDELAAGRGGDVLVLDEQMQDMDAADFLRGLRALRLARRPTVAVLAAHGTLQRLEALDEAGLVDVCLAKPFSAQELALRLRQLCRRRASGVYAYCARLCEAWQAGGETNGCLFLAEAVNILTRAPAPVALRKEVLLPVSELHQTTVTAVDSALRRLIDKAERENTPAYRQFKQAAGLGTARPPLGRLLTAAARAAENEEKRND